jgi:hypothetical protein
MPSKVEFGRRLRWVLPLRGRISSSPKEAPWRFHSLGCWPAKIAATLDTVTTISQAELILKATYHELVEQP